MQVLEFLMLQFPINYIKISQMKKSIVIGLIATFVISITLASCSSSKYSRVKSGSAMGNKADKNKHVWGK